jgi:hypothetical protein
MAAFPGGCFLFWLFHAEAAEKRMKVSLSVGFSYSKFFSAFLRAASLFRKTQLQSFAFFYLYNCSKRCLFATLKND